MEEKRIVGVKGIWPKRLCERRLPPMGLRFARRRFSIMRRLDVNTVSKATCGVNPGLSGSHRREPVSVYK